jgi:arylsulfatase A-like enzyme
MGYMPEVHADQMMDFISQTPAGESYLAYLGWVAPHNGAPYDYEDEPPSPYVAEPYRHTYDGPRVPRDWSFNEKDVSDKRKAIRKRDRLRPRAIARIAETRRQRRETLMAVDAKVEEVVGLVAARGELDETYFFFTSDNGYMEGQHRIANGKLQAYEPSAAVPMIVRGPGFEAGTTYRRVAGLQDLTPTLVDLADARLPADAPPMDGVSLRDLVDDTVATRRPQVLEIADNSRVQGERRAALPWLARGVVTNNQWKYVSYPLTDEVEMYHLKRDPHELVNLADRRRYRDHKVTLRGLLRTYRDCAGTGCA